MRLRPRTLRGRLTLVFAVVTAVLCLLVGFLVDFEYRRALQEMKATEVAIPLAAAGA